MKACHFSFGDVITGHLRGGVLLGDDDDDDDVGHCSLRPLEAMLWRDGFSLGNAVVHWRSGSDGLVSHLEMLLCGTMIII